MQKKKTAIITARMTPENKQKIEQRAANARMTVTDYLTTCALGKKIVRVDGLDKILA
ncbi:plasmid mobilization protein, partial [Faecalibaculum rodentium]|uniref:plasmid mobilization protein n=1 Tax=Faecalibaculum rodentium TaxID=1702221 RepID=UPI003C6CCE38